MKRLVLAFALALGVQAPPPAPVRAQFEDPHPRAAGAVTLLQLNDVYSTVPINGVGGLARVATLKQELAATGRTPLLVMSGDFLSSSVASTIFKGEQMIAALNAVSLDIATLGNHEFDFGVEVLLKRMAEAKWQWVVSNIVDRQTGKPIGGAAPYLVRTFGSLRVGFLGLCLTTESMPRHQLEGLELIDPMQAAAKYVPQLKSENVDAIVALTHLSYAEDRALAERFPEIDVILGGHEHFPIAVSVGRTLISKAGAEAKFVARIDLSRPKPGVVERFYELLPVTRAIKENASAAAVINSWEGRLGTALNQTIGRSNVSLDGVNMRLRVAETNLGNLVADAVRDEVKAEIAIINGGSVRSDRVYPRGTLSRRTLLEIHPFGNVVCKLSVPGKVVLAALNSGVSKLPAAAGQFPQVSGITFRVDPSVPPGDRVRDVKVNGAPLDLGKMYTLAVPDFMFQGGDGYTMFRDQKVLVSPEDGSLVVSALERYISSRAAVSPKVEGRITRMRQLP